MREIGVINTKVKTAIIIGGGRISFYLAKQLLESGIRVKIIEHNMNRCKELTEHLPKADIVCADGTDKHVLAQEGIDRVDSLVAMKSAKDTEMRTLYRIVNNKAEAMEFRVTRESELTSKSLSQIKMKRNVLIAAILRNNKIILPDGESKLEVGDTVVIVTTHHITTLGDILA